MVLRMMVLTESEAPTKTKASIASEKARDKPKAIVANPKATTETRKTGPWRRISSICEMIAAAMVAPIAWAADNHPYPTAPTCRTSRAKIGIRVLADEKKVAKKSSSMLDRMMGCARIKRTPSRMAEKLTAALP